MVGSAETGTLSSCIIARHPGSQLGSAGSFPHISASSGYNRMSRTNWKTVSTLVTTMALLVGCQDQSVVAPKTSVAPSPSMLAPAGAPQLDLAANAPNNAIAEFTVGPAGGVFYVGKNAVVFPAGSICDPATSSYGPESWDAPCREIHAPIHVRAVVVRAQNGRTWVDFSPELRFSPSANPSRWVWMYMSTPAALGAHDLSKFNILYASEIGGNIEDESSSDASLRTYVNTRSGMSYRRIKHFSGYTSSGGFACDPNTDADCAPDPTGMSQGSSNTPPPPPP